MMPQLQKMIILAILRGEGVLDAGGIAAEIGAPERLVEQAMKELERQGLLEEAKPGYRVADRVELALHAVGIRIDPYLVSKHLGWRDFEVFVARALEKYGYTVVRNLRIPPPHGMEVDVLGVGSLYGIAVDCKHWSPRTTMPSKLLKASKRHRERLSTLASRLTQWRPVKPRAGLVGVIVTLGDPGTRVLEGVGIVPVRTFHDFAARLEYYVESLNLHVAPLPDDKH